MSSDSHLAEPDADVALHPQRPGGREPAAPSAVITHRSPTAAAVNDMEQLVIATPPGDGSLGALLRACRHRAWLSQEQLAALADVSERTVRDLEAGRVRSPRTDTVRLLADALQLSEAERAGWFAAARGVNHRGVNHQRVGPAAAGVDGPARARGDARSRRSPTARPWQGQKSRGPPFAAAGFQTEIVEQSRRDGRSAEPAATDSGRTETAARARVSRAESRAGTRSGGPLSSVERRELARLRRE